MIYSFLTACETLDVHPRFCPLIDEEILNHKSDGLWAVGQWLVEAVPKEAPLLNLHLLLLWIALKRQLFDCPPEFRNLIEPGYN